MQQMQQRPIGVTLIATLAILWSIPVFLEVISLLMPASAGPIAQGGDPGVPGQAVAIAALAISVLYLVVGYGLWNMRRWGLYLALAIAGLHIVVNVAAAAVGGPTWAVAAGESVVPVILAAYLLWPGVRRSFTR